MSSGIANFGRIHFDDLQWERRYSANFSYAQSKLADLMMTLHLAAVAAERDWNLMSNAAHPGFTRTNLQTAGASLGRDKPKRTIFNSLHFLPVAGGRAGHRAAAVRRDQPGGRARRLLRPGRHVRAGRSHDLRPAAAPGPRHRGRRPALGRGRAADRGPSAGRCHPCLTGWTVSRHADG